MKILIVVPSFTILGGVANHYQGLAPFWKENVTYVIYGKRKHIPAIFTLIPDYLYFIFLLMTRHVDVVVVNPSLRYYQIVRDGVYLMTAKLFGKKIATFFHGWDDRVFENIRKHPFLFCKTYGKSNIIFTLYSGFMNDLRSLPLQCPVKLTTTKVSDSLVEDFDISIREGKINQILFLARVENSKGIDITLQAFEILKKHNRDLKLCVCGIGDALEQAKLYVKEKNIEGVSFEGFVKGDDRIKYFKDSQIYILPTTHGEGMATSVLESMAMGLVIISRPVGGVIDFFEEGKMGCLLESLRPEDYAKAIQKLIDNPEQVKDICIRNYQYAKEHFLASSVAAQLERDIREQLLT